jgi:hypothetical protein
MKFAILALAFVGATSAFAASNVPPAPEFFLNGQAISIAIFANGSARITEPCGNGEIDNFNTKGVQMVGDFNAGPLSTVKTRETVVATEVQSRKGTVMITFNPGTRNAETQILHKAKTPSTFEICL